MSVQNQEDLGNQSVAKSSTKRQSTIQGTFRHSTISRKSSIKENVSPNRSRKSVASPKSL